MNKVRTFFGSLISKLLRPAFFTKNYWDSIGQVHGNMSAEALDSYSNHIIQLIQPRPSERIMDIGCGEGSVTRIVEKHCNVKLIGMDFSKKLIQKAKRNGVTLTILGVAFKLPIVDGCLDKVYSFEVAQYISRTELEAYVLENLRVTHSDGIIYLLAVPDREKIFTYYVSFGQKIIYCLSILFKTGLFSSQIGYWHKSKDFVKIAEKFNLNVSIIDSATYRMDVILKKCS
jgi:cyclopropane fatty-acyl-phospholipid synthase-like methyltransferase